MVITTFFFDTYTFCEIIQGNQNYIKYVEDIGIITTKMNLMELYYGLLREYDRKTADKYYDSLIKYAVNVDDDTIKQAMVFKLLNKNKKLPYVDCIGYVLAKKRGVKFLTGDKEFERMENVEFVK
ncbi:MAG: PIN domain-containing protein [Candidatus Woesearchaeota archaeon]